MTRQPADDIADDVWHRFLERAIGGLREAARRVTDPAALEGIERRPGWFGKKNKTVGDTMLPDETSISQVLIEMMDDIRSAQYIAAPVADPTQPDLTDMDFHVEVARRYDPAVGPRAHPTDIQIAIHRGRLDLRIEAKKLTKQGEIAGDYLGPEGLGRFDDVRAPYTLERFGGMVAYVTDLDAAAWAELIATDIRAALPPERVTTTPVSGEDMITTTHVRDVDIRIGNLRVKGRFKTDVFHMVLKFDAWPRRDVAAAAT